MLNLQEQIFQQISQANNTLIVFKKNWDLDTVVSGLAMANFLEKIDKKANIACDNFVLADKFAFLIDANLIKPEISNLKKFVISLNTSQIKAKKVSYELLDDKLNFIIVPENGEFDKSDVTTSNSHYQFDLIITINTLDLKSLGNIYYKNTQFFYDLPIINIDHHSANEGYGQINLVELTATSTSEIVYDLIKSYDEKLLDKKIATLLLAGIIAETYSFKTNKVTPKSLQTAAQLIDLGAEREKIISKLYRSKTIANLKLWGRILARINIEADNKLVWSTLSKIDFIKTQAKGNDNLIDIIDELIINIPKIEIIVLIYQLPEENKTYGLIYSVGNIEAVRLGKKFNAQGDKKIAKFSLGIEDILEAEQKIIEEIKQRFDELIL